MSSSGFSQQGGQAAGAAKDAKPQTANVNVPPPPAHPPAGEQRLAPPLWPRFPRMALEAGSRGSRFAARRKIANEMLVPGPL